MIRTIVSVVIGLLLAGCNRETDVNKLDPFIQSVVTSTSADDERAAAQALWNALEGRKVEIEILVAHPNSEFEDALTAKVPHSGTDFKVVLSHDGMAKEFGWTPKHRNNVFILFREE